MEIQINTLQNIRDGRVKFEIILDPEQARDTLDGKVAEQLAENYTRSRARVVELEKSNDELRELLAMQDKAIAGHQDDFAKSQAQFREASNQLGQAMVLIGKVVDAVRSPAVTRVLPSSVDPSDHAVALRQALIQVRNATAAYVPDQSAEPTSQA